MPHNLLLKYLLDIESIIYEIEQLQMRYNNNFESFNNDFVAKRAIERHLEIIGEAVNKMTKIDQQLKITGTKNISLRNLIIHSYDTIDPGILWGIIQKDIPVLKEELQKLRE